MRYHFHIRDGAYLIPDEEGDELPNLAAAREEARLSARDLAIESLRRGAAINGRIEIANDAGAVLEVLPVRDVTLGS